MSARYLSIAEYADLAGVSHKTIRGMVARGELVAHRFGRVLRIDPEEAAEATVYQPEGQQQGGRRRQQHGGRPRPVRGDFSRRARGLSPTREEG